jgi:hypothetical protein
VIRRGSTRTVFLLGRYAVKVPRASTWRTFLNGLLANMQERGFAVTGWPELCPVLFSLPGGWIVVMRRARPLTDEEWFEFDPTGFVQRSDYCVPAEEKRDSFGMLDGRVVAVDYGT